MGHGAPPDVPPGFREPVPPGLREADCPAPARPAASATPAAPSFGALVQVAAIDAADAQVSRVSARRCALAAHDERLQEIGHAQRLLEVLIGGLAAMRGIQLPTEARRPFPLMLRTTPAASRKIVGIWIGSDGNMHLQLGGVVSAANAVASFGAFHFRAEKYVAVSEPQEAAVSPRHPGRLLLCVAGDPQQQELLPDWCGAGRSSPRSLPCAHA